MLRTILLLILALIVLPLVAFYSDAPLGEDQRAALGVAVMLMLSAALLCFAVSEFSGNYSQVDKLWSILPIAYAWYFAWAAGMAPRLLLMAVLVTVWGARLTANFARRGGYSWKFWTGEEDYRWGELRRQPLLSARWRFTLFNLFFISLYQNGLILLFTLPMVVAWQGGDTPLGWLDYLAAAAMLGFVVMETLADNQQYAFQTEKYRRIHAREKLDGDYADGFLQSGLWACFRHPNYAAEQAVWLSFYLFSVAATGRWINWSLAGAVLLLLLFQGSADFSEGISARKYPAYKRYQQTVGRFLPKFI
jgi:steroid 5-alpha reductase family enzyme